MKLLLQLNFNISFRRFIISFGGPALIALVFPCCKKSIEVDPPIDKLLSDQVFQSNAAANSAVTGMYGQMMGFGRNFYAGSIELYSGLTSDEFDNTNSYYTEDEFRNNSIRSDNATINQSFWAQPYAYIYTCNALIEGLEKTQALSDSVKNQLLGEAKFNRALNYFYLTNFFGDVPLITTTDYRIAARTARTAQISVGEQIVADLKVAQGLLKATYWTSGKARPNKWTATALLARVYLYQRQWANAELEASAVIQSGMYKLVEDVSHTFVLADNQEAIWTLLSASPFTNNSFYPSYFIPPFAGLVPTYTISPSLLNRFEAGDERKAAWISSTTVDVGGTPTLFNFPSKYKEQGGFGADVLESAIPFRLGEQFLIRAEARAMLNKIAEGKNDVDTLRHRAGLPSTSASDQTTLLAAVAHERQVELFGEWGHRWFDLKRTDRATPVLSPIKGPSWQPTDIYYPIPSKEILYNNLLRQNDGYN